MEGTEISGESKLIGHRAPAVIDQQHLIRNPPFHFNLVIVFEWIHKNASGKNQKLFCEGRKATKCEFLFDAIILQPIATNWVNSFFLLYKIYKISQNNAAISSTSSSPEIPKNFRSIFRIKRQQKAQFEGIVGTSDETLKISDSSSLFFVK